MRIRRAIARDDPSKAKEVLDVAKAQGISYGE